MKSLLYGFFVILLAYVLIGLYAPYYSIEEHGMGYETLGEYHTEKAPDVRGIKKFIWMANVVVIDSFSFGMYFKALSTGQEAHEVINEASNES